MKTNESLLLIHEQGCKKIQKDFIINSLRSINGCSKYTSKDVKKIKKNVVVIILKLINGYFWFASKDVKNRKGFIINSLKSINRC